MITSVRNPRVAAALKLHKRAFREREHAFLVEGAQVLGEALSGPGGGLSTLFHAQPSHELVERAAKAGAETIHVSEEVLERLARTVTPQGFVGVAAFVDVALADVPERPSCVAVLHAVRDPGNAGTVLRSADAVGADAVVFTSTSVDVYNEKTVRSSAGSLFHLPVVRGAALPEAVGAARAAGLTVLAADGAGERELTDLPELAGPTAWLFGNEAWGLPAETGALADARVRIPISPRAESLNLAAAAAVCLFASATTQELLGGAVSGRRAIP